MFAAGVSKVGELIDLGVEKKIVDKAGAWYSFREERLGQGREAAKTFLKENTGTAEEIETKIREQAGLAAMPKDAGSAEAENGKEIATGDDNYGVVSPLCCQRMGAHVQMTRETLIRILPSSCL